MRSNTVALVVSSQPTPPRLLATLTDDREIEWFETALREGAADPLLCVQERKRLETKEEDEFGDYVEDLLSQPFLHPDIQEHGVQWMKSKIRIEQFQKTEAEAAKIIAQYALKVFLSNPHKTDFFIAGATAQVRVRVFALNMRPGTMAA